MSYEELKNKYIELQNQHIKVLKELIELKKTLKKEEKPQIRCAKKVGTGGF